MIYYHWECQQQIEMKLCWILNSMISSYIFIDESSETETQFHNVDI